MGLGQGTLQGQGLGQRSGAPANRTFPTLTSLPLTPRRALGALPQGLDEEARVHSPKTVGVHLAQDTVIRGRQGVKPEVGEALVGIRLRGGGALKSIVAVRRKERGSGASPRRGPPRGDLLRTCLWAHRPIHMAVIPRGGQNRKPSYVPGEKGCTGDSGSSQGSTEPACVSLRAAGRGTAARLSPSDAGAGRSRGGGRNVRGTGWLGGRPWATESHAGDSDAPVGTGHPRRACSEQGNGRGLSGGVPAWTEPRGQCGQSSS